jgi:molybdenum cofactor cytidylyltransferase
MTGVALVLLAAGMSRRFGSPKQLFLFDGRPLVRLMAEKALASRASPVYVVLGACGDEVEAALAGLPIEAVFNPDFEAGQSTSVRCGLVAASGAEAILFLPVDMPFIQVETLDRLIAAWEKDRPAAVVPVYDGQRGAPVLWDRRLFPDLATLEGDQGGRILLSRLDPLLVEVDPHEGRDLDRPEDLPGSLPKRPDFPAQGA